MSWAVEAGTPCTQTDPPHSWHHVGQQTNAGSHRPAGDAGTGDRWQCQRAVNDKSLTEVHQDVVKGSMHAAFD
jgi:hypothetical protein